MLEVWSPTTSMDETGHLETSSSSIQANSMGVTPAGRSFLHATLCQHGDMRWTKVRHLLASYANNRLLALITLQVGGFVCFLDFSSS